MTTDQFAVITRRVIATEGFDEFQPTACYPSRREVKTLAGLPPDFDPEEPILEWAGQSAAEGEEFLVAFKLSEDSFRVIRRRGKDLERKDFHPTAHPEDKAEMGRTNRSSGQEPAG